MMGKLPLSNEPWETGLLVLILIAEDRPKLRSLMKCCEHFECGFGWVPLVDCSTMSDTFFNNEGQGQQFDSTSSTMV